MAERKIKHGVFDHLASNYSAHRPDYSSSVLKALSSLVSKDMKVVDFIDVGAGTGIWTRMVGNLGPKSITAVDPSDNMIAEGRALSDSKILWLKGTAESVPVESESADWVSMASSFHWAEFEPAMAEFSRILRSGGWFTALWNPRRLEDSPLLMEIENHLKFLKGDLERVSSGTSGFTSTLHQRLDNHPNFGNAVYMESVHTIRMSRDRYLGVWKSVNDLQYQLGEQKFQEFLAFIWEKTNGLEHIDASYRTRAWSAQRN